MAAVDGHSSGHPSFAEMAVAAPQPLPEISVAHRVPKVMDGEIFFQFSKEEINRSAEPFRFSIVIKFLRQRPSLDAIRAFIANRWGLSSIPVVSSMKLPRNVFIRLATEADFVKVLSHESCEVNGVAYCAFHWSPDFNEEHEPSNVPVWILLPGLPPNFYQESFLQIFTAPLGRFIRRDNSTCCATRTDGARLCLEMDAAKEPISYFWIGTPGLATSRKQEIIFETLPAYCGKCRVQGHNSKTCRAGKPKQEERNRGRNKEKDESGGNTSSQKEDGEINNPLFFPPETEAAEPVAPCEDEVKTQHGAHDQERMTGEYVSGGPSIDNKRDGEIPVPSSPETESVKDVSLEQLGNSL
ncbi:hypothetical protein F2P56_009258 [Juglans regia]|uniref:DUF4283 domain-containing protein n=2 Tax=Juglans regia TaxID=51240 RepID=A0A833XN31_JUGRE|nr:uncharacterized protein LOC108986898 [Juglans regia]KAF5472547.1 hypothetical protein F2P56_009258 [Juglans regia]